MYRGEQIVPLAAILLMEAFEVIFVASWRNHHLRKNKACVQIFLTLAKSRSREIEYFLWIAYIRKLDMTFSEYNLKKKGFSKKLNESRQSLKHKPRFILCGP